MFDGLVERLRQRRRGYELEPGEAEIGRMTVGTDLGSGLAILENEKLALTDRRLLLMKARLPLVLILIPIALVFALRLHPFTFPVLAIALLLGVQAFNWKVAAAQRREDIVACATVPAEFFLVKPKLVLIFRDGTKWRLHNPNRGPGRLDAIVRLLHKGGIEVEVVARAPTRSTSTG